MALASQPGTPPFVVIVGGSGGIGRQIAADYLADGAAVMITGKDPGQLDAVYQTLRKISSQCYAVQCDIADMQNVSRLAAEVQKLIPSPTILINCAGYATYRTFEESDFAETEQLIQVNLIGAMRCVKAFLPQMIAQKQGTIVNMASLAGRIPITPNGTYSAAKHAIVAWSQNLRYELHRYNIQVQVICPGRVETDFFADPTFQNRRARPETRLIITTSQISAATRAAIKQNRFLTYVPRSYALLIWLINVSPWLVKPLYNRLMLNRIESYYHR